MITYHQYQESNLHKKREITINSYSETISSKSSSEDRTLTAETEETSTSIEEHISNNTSINKTEDKVTEVESAWHQIASSLQSSAEAYMTLASHICDLDPYKIPQIISQIPPPPVNISVPMQKALAADTEDKVMNYLICDEY